MRLRLKSVLTALVTTGMLAGMLGFAQVAHAALTPPPFEPDPNARGCLNFYDANGSLVTSGDINTTPPVAFALGDGRSLLPPLRRDPPLRPPRPWDRSFGPTPPPTSS